MNWGQLGNLALALLPIVGIGGLMAGVWWVTRRAVTKDIEGKAAAENADVLKDQRDVVRPSSPRDAVKRMREW